MPRIPAAELSRYLLAGQIRSHGCLRTSRGRLPIRVANVPLRPFSSPAPTPSSPVSLPVPLRKQLRDEAKALKASGLKKKKKKVDNQTVPGWELTVGIEIHAQLNTTRKLFSPAATSFNDDPNTHVALFDVAIPGSQPIFQPETLVPAVRAALALHCDVRAVSRFDRKHYFHWDQPSGYQITQYYEPFAKNGHIRLFARDGIAAEDGESMTVGIKQVQMEQDTAKTTAQPGDVQWLDFNRVGIPLIEIITLPDIHHPATAAALVRKVQAVLNSVDACVLGMEAGGLRADVNVSVRRTDDATGKLGTRTEIKNLSSFKAVEDAIIAERDRQIAVLKDGGVIEGETRGWTLGGTETRRLRGKEGEVDYRYMPDPDLAPVVIDQHLVQYLASSSGLSPDEEAGQLMERYDMTAKDAISLMTVDNGGRVQYFYNVLDALERRLIPDPDEETAGTTERGQFDRGLSTLAANWCLHELGKLTEVSSDLGMSSEGECKVPSIDLAAILYHLYRKEITAKVAKELLWAVFRGEVGRGDVTETIERHSLWFHGLSDKELADLADLVVEGEDKILGEFARFADGKSKAYPQGKLMFLVGKMMRTGPEQRMDPASAEKVMKTRIETVYLPAFRSRG